MRSIHHFPDRLPELHDRAVHLRELNETDIPGWYLRATDIESAELAGDPVPTCLEMGRPWLQRQRDALRDKRALRWAIVPSGASESIGTIGLTLSAPGSSMAELGIVIARAHWGRGLGTLAARLVLDHAFETLQWTEVGAEVLQRNLRSIRLLERSGFRLIRVQPPTDAEPEVLLRYSLTAEMHGAR